MHGLHVHLSEPQWHSYFLFLPLAFWWYCGGESWLSLKYTVNCTRADNHFIGHITHGRSSLNASLPNIPVGHLKCQPSTLIQKACFAQVRSAITTVIRFIVISSSALFPPSRFHVLFSISPLLTPDPLPKLYLPPAKTLACSAHLYSLPIHIYLETEICFSHLRNNTLPGTTHDSNCVEFLFCTFSNETLGAKDESQQ